MPVLNSSVCSKAKVTSMGQAKASVGILNNNSSLN